MKKKSKAALYNVLIYAMIIGGSLLLLYPLYTNFMFKYYSDQSRQEYEQAAAEKDENYKQTELAKAQAYNSSLSTTSLLDPFSTGTTEDAGYQTYLDTLSLSSSNGIDGVMGYISIPKIDVELPIFHGTSDEVLYEGVGHIVGTSLPVGGTGTHAVLTGHTGLTNRKLFTDLTQLEIGDQFIITVLDEKLAYQIDDISVIEPTDTSWFTIEPDQDKVTLFTCTPYGINSHRLLVTGHRIPYEEVQDAQAVIDWYTVIALTLIAAMIIWLIIRNIKKKKKAAEQPPADQSQDQN